MRTKLTSIGRFIIALIIGVPVWNQHDELLSQEMHYKHSVEFFPLVVLAKIYSIQYTYALTPKDHLIVGFSYVHIDVEDADRTKIGKFNAPTLPIGYRRYVWKNLHVEYQLWPAYNMYYETTERKYYNGFDLYNEFRIGYEFVVAIGSLPILFTPQYVFGFGVYPGNKPDSFIARSREIPYFHAPTLAVGVKF